MSPADSSSKKRESVRTCCACRQPSSPTELIRWVRGEDGHVVPDLAARGFGRGAWIHPHPSCLKSLRSALQRSFRAPIATETAEGLLLLQRAAEHRAKQLLGLARRRGLLDFGADSTAEAWRRGEVELLVVARDAQAGAKLPFVEEAVTQKKAVCWSNKEELGRLFGRPEVALVSLRDRGLARGLFGAIAMALLVQDPIVGEV